MILIIVSSRRGAFFFPVPPSGNNDKFYEITSKLFPASADHNKSRNPRDRVRGRAFVLPRRSPPLWGSRFVSRVERTVISKFPILMSNSSWRPNFSENFGEFHYRLIGHRRCAMAPEPGRTIKKWWHHAGAMTHGSCRVPRRVCRRRPLISVSPWFPGTRRNAMRTPDFVS